MTVSMRNCSCGIEKWAKLHVTSTDVLGDLSISSKNMVSIVVGIASDLRDYMEKVPLLGYFFLVLDLNIFLSLFLSKSLKSN